MSIHRINPKKVDDLIETPGKHCDGGGLYLQVADNGAASYVWRHKERWASIGPASVYKIEEARETARELRKAVHEGRDPFQMLTAGRARPVGKTFAQAMGRIPQDQVAALASLQPGARATPIRVPVRAGS